MGFSLTGKVYNSKRLKSDIFVKLLKLPSGKLTLVIKSAIKIHVNAAIVIADLNWNITARTIIS